MRHWSAATLLFATVLTAGLSAQTVPYVSGQIEGYAVLSISSSETLTLSSGMDYKGDIVVPDVQYEMQGTLAITNAHAGAESYWNNGGNPLFRGILQFPADQNRCYGGYSAATADVIGYQGRPIPRIRLDSVRYDATTVCDLPPPPPPPPAGWQPPSDGGTTWFDPLVLDLTGDGIRTTGRDRPVSFDLDGNGRKEWITWTDPSSFDAFLWIDLFGKNRVDNGSELFGVGTVLPDGSKAKDGFEALAIYDAPARGGNGDGLIDSHDRVWPKLRLWVDLNHNGLCEPGETWPVQASGIDGISLATVRSTTIDSSGNTHFLHGTYWRRTGRAVQTFSVDSIGFRGQ